MQPIYATLCALAVVAGYLVTIYVSAQVMRRVIFEDRVLAVFLFVCMLCACINWGMVWLSVYNTFVIHVK